MYLNKILFYVLILVFFVIFQKASSESLKAASKQTNSKIINRNKAKESTNQQDKFKTTEQEESKTPVIRIDSKQTKTKDDTLLDTDSNEEKDAEYLSLEDQLHGETHQALSGKHRSFGTVDQESLLHDGDHDVHNREPIKKPIDEGETNMEREIEEILHGDDGHAHDRPAFEEADDGKAFDANDPEHTMHDEDVHDPNRVSDEEEDDVESRRPFNPENIEGKIDSMTREDFLDYQEWRENRHVGKKNWMSGFNYLGDSLKINLDAIKNRYLSKFFDGEDANKTNIHDEA